MIILSLNLKIGIQSILKKFGWIKINEQLPIGVNYSNPRIRYDNKYCYISVGIK